MARSHFLSAAGLALLLALPPAARAAGPASQPAPAMSMPMQGMSMNGTAMPMGTAPADTRRWVAFPAPMRRQMLGNMRDHVRALNAILQALATADYAAASRIATARLGLDSPAAAACTPKPANAAAQSGSMDAMMALYMPKSMRAIGLAMHTDASAFAAVAHRAATTHDGQAVITALSRVTRHCVACHAGYRLR